VLAQEQMQVFHRYEDAVHLFSAARWSQSYSAKGFAPIATIGADVTSKWPDANEAENRQRTATQYYSSALCVRFSHNTGDVKDEEKKGDEA
jgi:hypothetical protein